MDILKNKIDFAALVSVTMANCNGDPLNGNRPRTDYDGLGEMSDVCIKRKIRNRMQDMGKSIFVQSDGRETDAFRSLKDRADGCPEFKAESAKGKKADRDKCVSIACKQWLDVRTFGQVFAFKGDDASIGVRGPVSIHQAVSLSPVEVRSMQITKSVNAESGKEGKASDTMGMKHFIRYGLYLVKGSINVQLAEKTGFTEDDAEVLKECLRTLFVNDASSARPDGSMEVVKLFWWKHNCKDGQYSSAAVHRSLKVALKDKTAVPYGIEDYAITLESLEGLTPEIITGI